MKFIIFILLPTISFCQTPHLSGNVFVNTLTGQINCDLTLSNMPKSEDPTFILNQGMNVEFVKVDNKQVGFDQLYDDAFKYDFNRKSFTYRPSVDTLYSTSKIEIKYTGSFPVYNDDNNNSYSDDMGTIAFKNNILRASHQSKWYPIFFDKTLGVNYSRVTYDIKVSTEKEVSIFINGIIPKKSKNLRCIATVPNDLVLYLGDYKFSNTEKLYFLNSAITKVQQQKIYNSIKPIREFYEKTLDISYQDTLTFAQIFTVGRKEQYEKFNFAVYPSFTVDINGLALQINNVTNQIKDIETYRIFAHEMAHRFFGLTLKSNTQYWGFYSESFSEYFSLKCIEQKFERPVYQDYLKKRYLTEKNLKKSFTTLDSLTSNLNPNSWYTYYPLAIIGLETIIGQERVFNLFKVMIQNSEKTNLDYNSFKSFAKQSGINDTEWNLFETKFVRTNNYLALIEAIYK